MPIIEVEGKKSTVVKLASTNDTIEEVVALEKMIV